MPLDALLFDVDGTLAETEPHGHRPAYNAAFRGLGLGWHWDRRLYRQLLLTDGGRERIAYYLDAHDPDLGEQAEAVTSDRDSWIEDVHHSKSHHFARRVKKGLVPLRPGVSRLFREAAEQGVRIAIVSNASRRTFEPFIAHTLGDALAGMVSLSICGDDVLAKKPSPEPYALACRRLGCDPNACIAIEDSSVGLRSAVAAGIRTVVTVNDDTCRQCFDGAALVLDSLGEPDAPAHALPPHAFDHDCVNLGVLEALLRTA